jgi:hypothetical protein
LTNLPTPVTADGEIIAYDDRWKSLPFLDDEGMQRLIVDQVFNATTLEEAAKDFDKAVKMPEFAGEAVTIHAAWLRQSTIEDGTQGVYALIDLEWDGHGRYVVTNGSPQVISVIARAASEDALPWQGRVVLGEPSKKGRSAPIRLVRRVRAGDKAF